MNQAVATVECPRCKRTELTTLAREEDRQRYQCKACNENFTAPAPAEKSGNGEAVVETSFIPVPIQIPEKDAAGVAGHCPKCQKPYLRLGKFYESHVVSCDGTPFVHTNRRAGGTLLPVSAPAAATPPALAPAEASPVPSSITKAFEVSIEALKAQRSVLETEIAEINRTITTLEKLKGLGGASAPFQAGA